MGIPSLHYEALVRGETFPGIPFYAGLLEDMLGELGDALSAHYSDDPEAKDLFLSFYGLYPLDVLENHANEITLTTYRQLPEEITFSGDELKKIRDATVRGLQAGYLAVKALEGVDG